MNATILLFCFAILAWTHQDSCTWSIYPKVKTRNEQCIESGYAGACDFRNPNGTIQYTCRGLKCANQVIENVYVRHFSTAHLMEKSYCGPNSYCENEMCKTVDESEMPFYTGPETKIEECN